MAAFDPFLRSILVVLFLVCWPNDGVSAYSSPGHSSVSRQIQPKFPLAGGYVPASLNDPNVREAFKFANTILLSSNNNISRIKLVAAETQIVAGINVRLSLQICTGSTIKSCQAVVSIPLPSDPNNTLQLRSLISIALNLGILLGWYGASLNDFNAWNVSLLDRWKWWLNFTIMAFVTCKIATRRMWVE